MTGNLALKQDQFTGYTYQHLQGVMLVTLNTIAYELKLSHSEYRLMATLISFWNKQQNVAFPDTRTLSKLCNMSNTTILKGLKKLSQLDFIKITTTLQNNRHNYFINLEKFLPSRKTTLATPCKTAHVLKPTKNKTYKEHTSYTFTLNKNNQNFCFNDDIFKINSEKYLFNNIDRVKKRFKPIKKTFRTFTT